MGSTSGTSDRRRRSVGPGEPLSSATLPDAVATLAGADADLAAVVDRIGTPPLWGRPPGFATLVRIILGQQVSLGSADAAYRRLQATVGRVCPGSVAAAAESRLRRAGLTRQKAAYCRNLAIAVTSGGLSLKTVATLDDAAARAQLVRVPGIGPWTADIYLLMALRRPDIWPDGDLALIKAAQRVKRLRQPPDSATLRTLASAWSPWRAVAARVLWHEYLSW